MTKLAIIGAGAKAAAIAAKSDCLNRSGRADLSIALFERGMPANSWSGSGGYSNGDQQLCTPAERDVGFPYETVFGDEVAELMQAEYSWMAYAVRNRNVAYSDWINRGGVRPSHREFADYLRFVINQSRVAIYPGHEVTALADERGAWAVVTRSGSGVQRFGPFDGVVITGPGPAIGAFGSFSDPALFDGENVWRRLPELKEIISKADERIAIVGGGGAAAAIAAWLISEGFADHEIAFVARQATFYVRTGGYFENRIFDDDEFWSRLGPDEQNEFVNRITRAVVWEAVANKLVAAKKITLVPGRAKSIWITPAPAGAPRTLTIGVERGTPKLEELEACAVIDASGFDRWWFTKLLPGTWKTETEANLKAMATRVDYHLRFPVAPLPPLHTPVVSQAAGPGYSSLMVLGRMADRILGPYVYP